MSTIKKARRQVKATKVQQQDIVNFHYSVEQVKAQKKANDLIKPTHVELFETIKSNLIIIDKVEGIEGYAQLINRKLNRFDVTKFKEENPDTYTKYLVPMETNEIKIKYQRKDK